MVIIAATFLNRNLSFSRLVLAYSWALTFLFIFLSRNAMRATTLAEAIPHVLRMENASIEVISTLNDLAVDIRQMTRRAE